MPDTPAEEPAPKFTTRALEKRIRELEALVAAPAFTSDGAADDPRRNFVERIIVASVLSKGVGILAPVPIAGTRQPPQVISFVREAHNCVEQALEMLDGHVTEPSRDPESETFPRPVDDDTSDVSDFDAEAELEALETGADL